MTGQYDQVRLVALISALALCGGGCGGGGGGSDGGIDAAVDASVADDVARPEAGPDAAPWTSPEEVCGNARDEDLDGLNDDDCPPSLWHGLFTPGGAVSVDGGVLPFVETGTGTRRVAVLQTYRGTSAAAVARIGPDLEAIWSHGSIAHLNLEPSGYSAAQYAAAATDPAIDTDLRAVASAIAAALDRRGSGRVLITFGAEMNGDWTDWGCLPPATYIAFHNKLHDLVRFALRAQSPPIDSRRVRWVFGPNSTSSAGCGTAAAYYPGHAYVDYLGMSAYRSGTATVNQAIVTPAHALLTALAYPAEWQTDRFIVLQTGTRDVAGDDRGAWLQALVETLRDDPVFLGFIYFNDSDWAVVAGNPAAGLTGWEQLRLTIQAQPYADFRLEGTFEPFFWDVPRTHAQYAEIQALRAAGLTSGCAAAPPRYCPDVPLQRGDAAVLLSRAFQVTAAAAEAALPACAAAPCTTDPVSAAAMRAAITTLAKPPASSAEGAWSAVDPVTRASAAAWLIRSANIAPADSP